MTYYLLAMHQPVGDPPPPDVLGPIMDALDELELPDYHVYHARRTCAALVMPRTVERISAVTAAS